MKKKICFDLDGTLCTNTFGSYEQANPINKAIDKVNELYENGNYIIVFTARYMGKSKGDAKKAYEIGYSFTKNQIDKWGLKYHELILGKPEYDIIIDDKSIFYKDNWYEDFKTH